MFLKYGSSSSICWCFHHAPLVVAQLIETMEGMLDVLFNGLVVHRFRDFSPAVRADVVTLLGEWAQSSKIFRQNKYGRRFILLLCAKLS